MNNEAYMGDSIGLLAEALAKAQAEMTFAPKDSANPHFKSRYADLAGILAAVRPALTKHGLAVVQLVEGSVELVSVRTVLVHSSGQWMGSTVTAKPMKADAQQMGSAITYLRRYALAAICGIAQDDDDGNAASGHATPNRQQAQAMAPKPAPTPATTPTRAAETAPPPAVEAATVTTTKYPLNDKRQRIFDRIETLEGERVPWGLPACEGDDAREVMSDDDLLRDGATLAKRLTWGQYEALYLHKHGTNPFPKGGDILPEDWALVALTQEQAERFVKNPLLMGDAAEWPSNP